MPKNDPKEQGQFFSTYRHGDEQGPVVYDYHPEIEPRNTENQPQPLKFDLNERGQAIKGAMAQAANYNKSERLFRLEPWQVISKGYDPDTLERHMHENYRALSQCLGRAAINCPYYQDGSCVIKCDPYEWLEKHRRDKSRKEFRKKLKDDSAARC